MTSIYFITNLFLGKLSNPDLAIAGFGVAFALVRAILAPLKSLVQTAQTLLCAREDFSVLIKFVVGLQLIFIGIIFGLFYTPLRTIFLEGVMGLNLELSNYITPGIRMIVIVAVFWGFSSSFRGMLAAIRSTFAIAVTAVMRLIIVTAVGTTALFFPDLNGTIIGITAMSSAFMVESILLGWRLYVEFGKPGIRFASSEN